MKTRTLLLIPLFAANGVAQAGSPSSHDDKAHDDGHGRRHHVAAMFEQMDTDRDGRITREEMQARHDEKFSALDANGDGLLSRDELLEERRDAAQARIEARLDRHMEKLDWNDDGAVSREEHSAGADTLFARLDRDGDGALSRDDRRHADDTDD